MLRRDDTMLMVRKRGTTAYMLPGGKPEPGEAPIDTIIREVDEELGLPLTREDLEELGTFEAPAANEADHQVIGEVFVHRGMPDGFDFDDIRPTGGDRFRRLVRPRCAAGGFCGSHDRAAHSRDRVVPALARHGG